MAEFGKGGNREELTMTPDEAGDGVNSDRDGFRGIRSSLLATSNER